MVQAASSSVNSPMGQAAKNLLIQQAIIWGGMGILAMLFYFSGAEQQLAHSVYQPNLQTPWGYAAWQVRQYGAFPIGIFASICLLAMFWPKFHQRAPLLFRSCVVIAFTALLGAGLFNQVIVKQLADRPRPRESVLLAEQPTPPPGAELQGNSMPSGHAGIGYVLAAPFFVLYPRRRRLAYGTLAFGMGVGTGIGIARMVLGAHFVSDILIAGAISLSTASFIAYLLVPEHRQAKVLKRILAPLWPQSGTGWSLLFGTLSAALALLYTALNAFTLSLTLPLPQPFRSINIPCTINTLTNQTQLSTPTLHVQLKGYGAPLSQLQLTEKEGVITLQTQYGFYRNLSCTAQLLLPSQAE